jgi:phosphoglycolate phosphatase
LAIKLIIFDFDGTLVDTALDITVAANRLMAHYGLPALTFEEVRTHIGEGFTPFIRAIAQKHSGNPHLATEVFDLFQKFYDEKLMPQTTFYNGAENFLRDFQNHPRTKIGVISNKPEYQVRIILKGLKVDEAHLVQIYGGDTFDVKKPHPKPLQEMMALAKVKPHETVMIGDSKADVEAAKAAHTHFIAVSFGYNTEEVLKTFGATNFIHHFDELIQILESLGAQAG